MEENIYKTYKHNPPHLFIPDAIYMITGATYLKESFFHNDKRIFLKNIDRNGGIIGIPVLLIKNRFLPELITSIITL